MAGKGAAVLFAEMTAPADGEEAFNDWQDRHAVPGIVRGVPGALSAMRYRSEAGPYYLSVLELTDQQTLEGEAARAALSAADAAAGAVLESVSGRTRYLAVEAAHTLCPDVPEGPLDAPVLHCVFHTVPFEQTAAFDDWLDHEQRPVLLRCPGWLMVRRFDLIACDPEYHTHLILHYLDDAGVAGSDTARRALGVEGGPEPWFEPRTVTYRRHGARFLAAG